MSFASKVLYTGDGSTTNYNIPMPYISASHIDVYVDTILQLDPMNYSFSGASTIVFGTAPGDESAIEVRRNTSPTAALVDFVNGSVLNESDLDTAYLHNYYLSQEYADSFNELINNAFLVFAADTGIVSTATADIINELTTKMLEEDAAANLQARITDIDDNAEAILTLGEGLQLQINTLASGIAATVYLQDGEPVPGVGGIPDPIADGARWYDTNDNNAAYIYVLADLEWVDINDPRIGNNATAITALQVETGDNAAAIVAEQVVRSNADSAMASDLALIGVANGGDTAWIIDLDTVHITDGVETLADRFTTISAAYGQNAADIITEAATAASATGAVATTMSLIGAENGGGTAFILDEDTVKIASDGGDTIAERFTALSATDGVNAASITTINSVTIPGINSNIDDIEAEYGVDLDVNGYITGFRIINGGTPGASAFVIRSDNFAIVDTSGGGLSEYVPFEISGGKINMRSDVSIDGDLMVTGTINGTALINGTLGSTQIGANAITTTQLNAAAVTAGKIDANAVTATKISVTDLAAISADLGSITAGDITVDSSGFIKGGQTAFDTGSGFWLGYDSAYKFSIGNGGDQSMTWDGTTLTVQGDLIVGTYIVSNAVLQSADTERISTAHSTTWVKRKSFTLDKDGNCRIKFQAKHNNGTGGHQTEPGQRMYKNGVYITGTEVTYAYAVQDSYAEESYDVEDLVVGDTIEIWSRGGLDIWAGNISMYIKEADFCADINLGGAPTVELD